MIPYELKVRDIEYYWQGALLLWECKGSYLPVTVRLVGSDGDPEPISLRRYDTAETVATMSVNTFVKTCLIHFPAMGYADLDGIPVFISPRAGQHRLKGIDQNNVVMVSPIAVQEAAADALHAMTMKLRAAILKDPSARLSKPDTLKRDRLQRLIKAARLNTNVLTIPRMDAQHEHRVVEQAVNKWYMTIPSALRYMKKPGVIGVAISTNCCILKDKELGDVVYARTTPVGVVESPTSVALFSRGELALSLPARKVLATLLPFQHIKI